MKITQPFISFTSGIPRVKMRDNQLLKRRIWFNNCIITGNSFGELHATHKTIESNSTLAELLDWIDDNWESHDFKKYVKQSLVMEALDDWVEPLFIDRSDVQPYLESMIETNLHDKFHKLHLAITYISNVASNLISKYYFDRPYQLRFVLPMFNPCDNIVFF